jgi:hypothetical protein
VIGGRELVKRTTDVSVRISHPENLVTTSAS